VLVEVDGPLQAAALAGWAREHLAAEEVVPGATTVLLDGVGSPAAVREALAGWSPRADAAPGPLVEVPVVFDGPDLAYVAERWGLSVEAAVARLTEVELTSAFCGFAPGFAYLAGLREEWSVPRLASPRPRVDPGSVGLAGAFCGIYPTASPGGWRLVGRSEVVLWDLDRLEPALLAPGTRVRLREAGR